MKSKTHHLAGKNLIFFPVEQHTNLGILKPKFVTQNKPKSDPRRSGNKGNLPLKPHKTRPKSSTRCVHYLALNPLEKALGGLAFCLRQKQWKQPPRVISWLCIARFWLGQNLAHSGNRRLPYILLFDQWTNLFECPFKGILKAYVALISLLEITCDPLGQMLFSRKRFM